MIVKFGYEVTQAIIAEKKRQKITAQRLAQKSGISKATIDNLAQRPETAPGMGTCLPLLHALGLEMVIVRRKTCTDSCPIEGSDAD